MALTGETKPLILDGQYIRWGNIEIIRASMIALFQKRWIMCRPKPYPYLMHPSDALNHLRLLDPVWGDYAELELIDLAGVQTLLRFYQARLPDLEELMEYEGTIRKDLYRPPIALWFYEGLNLQFKVIEILAEELHEHRMECLRNLEELLLNALGLTPYLLSYFEIKPAPPAGISPSQPVESQLEIEKTRDIPKKPKSVKPDTTLRGQNQELLRLWTDGLTAKEIGQRIGKTEKTIHNKITALRMAHGEERVPRRK